MKTYFTALFILFCSTVFAQIDTVIIQADSSMISHFSRKLNFERHSLKYTMLERGRTRAVIVLLSTLTELETGKVHYGVRIDRRGNRNLFTDAPLDAVEYIDEDELQKVIDYLTFVLEKIMITGVNDNRYTEYRFYTRGGIMFECYTGVNRWRFAINYKRGLLAMSNMLTLDKADTLTYINDPDDIEELRNTFRGVLAEINNLRKAAGR